MLLCSPRGSLFLEGSAGRTEIKSAKKITRWLAPGAKDKMGLRSVEMMEESHLLILVEKF